MWRSLKRSSKQHDNCWEVWITSNFNEFEAAAYPLEVITDWLRYLSIFLTRHHHLQEISSEWPLSLKGYDKAMKLELIIALTLKRAAYLKTWRDFSWVVIREMTHKMTRLWRKDWQQPPEDFSSTKKTLLGLLTKEPVQKMPLGLKTQFEWLAKMSFCYMLQWEISSWRAEILILQSKNSIGS